MYCKSLALSQETPFAFSAIQERRAWHLKENATQPGGYPRQRLGGAGLLSRTQFFLMIFNRLVAHKRIQRKSKNSWRRMHLPMTKSKWFFVTSFEKDKYFLLSELQQCVEDQRENILRLRTWLMLISILKVSLEFCGSKGAESRDHTVLRLTYLVSTVCQILKINLSEWWIPHIRCIVRMVILRIRRDSFHTSYSLRVRFPTFRNTWTIYQKNDWIVRNKITTHCLKQWWSYKMKTQKYIINIIKNVVKIEIIDGKTHMDVSMESKRCICGYLKTQHKTNAYMWD